MKQGKHITFDGTEEWFQDGKWHRLGSPAYRHPGGIEYWLKDGEWHRLDGSAYTHPDGTESWQKEGWCWPDQSRDWWERRR